MTSFNVVTRSNANAISKVPKRAVPRAFSGRELSAGKEPSTAEKVNRAGKRSVMLPMRNSGPQRETSLKGKKKKAKRW